MKAIVIREPGDANVLVETERPDPRPASRQVLVEVHAAALNRADLLQRRGRYPAPADSPPDVPGLEFAGEVVGRGRGVRRWKRGARVMGIVGGGAYAERLVLDERLCMPVPPALDWTAAAAVPEAFLTAFDALFARAGLAAGETVLVHAASSGVGTAACQLALLAGATVVGLSRSPAKHRRLRDLGLEHVVDPSAEDAVGAIRAAAGEDGVDVVIQLVGGTSLRLDLDVLARRGRIVVVGLMGGTRAEIDLGRLLALRATLIGTVLRTRSLNEKIDLTRRFARRWLPAFDSGALRPVVDRVMPWSRVAEAHRRMESDVHVGKIVLEVGT